MKHFNFFRLFLVLWMLLCNVFVFADDLITEQVVVNVEEPGTLPDKISEADKDRITNLKLIGALESKDVLFIREMAGAGVKKGIRTLGRLAFLDIQECKIVRSQYNSYYFDGSSMSHQTNDNSIGDYMFCDCLRLEKLFLPKGITDIGYSAFKGCENLETIEIPVGVNYIASAAFSGCVKLNLIDLPDGIMEINNSLFYGCKSITRLNLPQNVSSIGSLAFSNCTSLKTITIPFQVASIGESAFNGCKSLDDLVIPDAVKSIEESTFYGCSNLKTIKLSQNIIYIGPNAFRGCKSIKEIELPSHVLDLGRSTFADCEKLVTFSMPNEIKIIPDEMFYGCSSLRNIVLPSSLEKIGISAFYACDSLQLIKIPYATIQIGNQAFRDCRKMKKITCDAITPPSLGSDVFNKNLISQVCLYIPKDSYNAYRTAEVWRDFGQIKTIGSDETQEPKDPEPCSVPAITYTSGNLSFESSTPGAEYHYTIKDADVATDKYNTDGKVLLNGKLDISVYATADGYKASDKATATLYWLNAEGGDDTNNINLVKTRGVMVTTDSDITISGLNDGEVVTFYSVNGVNLGNAKAVQGVLHFAKPNESIVIAKIRGNDLKIAIK